MTKTDSNTWLLGGGLAALGAIIALLFTENGGLTGALGFIAAIFLAKAFTVARGKGRGNRPEG